MRNDRHGTMSGIAALTLLLAAGCSGGAGGANGGLGGLTPKNELSRSVSDLQNHNALTATLAVDATAADLVAASRVGGSASSGMTAQQAALIAGASISFELKAPAGKTLAQISGTNGGAVDVIVHLDGADVVEFRIVGGSVYVHTDAPKIVQILGKPASVLTNLENQLPPAFSFVRAAIQGQWLSVSKADAGALVQRFGAAASPNATQRQAFITTLRNALLANVTVTRSGSTSAGDHLVLTGSVRTIVSGVFDAYRSMLGNNPLFSRFSKTQIPDRDVALDAYVQGGSLSQLSLNLLQFAPASQAAALAGKHIAASVSLLTSGADINAPGSSTPLNLTALLAGLSGIFGSGASNSSSVTATAAPLTGG